MTDEKYLFIQDVKDKKRTARSSHNRRTHAGKSGGVKLPSDYLTKKELAKMNGETTTYRINAPMTWAEFKAMPHDLQALYLDWIREKFTAPDSAIAEMLGVHRTYLCKYLKRIGLQNPNPRGPRAIWDTEGFAAWRNDSAADATAATGPSEEAKKTRGLPELECDDDLRKLAEEAQKAPVLPVAPEQQEPELEMIPIAGCMNFEGPADQALRVIGNVLGSACVRLHVSWNPTTTEDDLDGGR